MEQIVKPRISYPQKWHEYNLSQTSEKLMFMDLLKDVCTYIRYNKPKRRGRPSNDLTEMLYCMGMLVYAGKSSRRTISELHISKDKGIISRVPHFNSVLNYFNEESVTEQLKKLIQLSSFPLKHIEEDFTLDASGFSTSMFKRWFDFKWGKDEGKERIWRKAHVMSGVKTNIITSIEIENCHEATKFVELVKKTDEVFSIKEVSADKAYLSRENIQLVSDIGGICYIPFKSTSTIHSKGSMAWRPMFKFFFNHQEEFMKHYHKRSNAEAVFSMIKRKFGMNLRTKTERGQINEILCKALCHNLVVLIHEVFEIGISTDFEEHYTKLNYCAKNGSAQINDA